MKVATPVFGSGLGADDEETPCSVQREQALEVHTWPRSMMYVCRICILHALRINDHEAGLLVLTTADTDRANPIFLTPAQAG